MRIFVCLFALFVACSAQVPCESPSQWESRNIYFNPIVGHSRPVEAHYSYDKLGQRKRWLEIEPEGENGTYRYVDRIALYAERKEYEIDLRTRECHVYEQRFPFYPHDVPQGAHFRGLFYLGSDAVPEGSVEFSDWEYHFSDSYWDGSFTTHGCIPYESNHYNRTTFGARWEHIIDVTPGISDPNVFIPPPQCSQGN